MLLKAEVFLYAFVISVHVQLLTLPHPSDRKDREAVTKNNLEASHPCLGERW